MPLPTCQVDSFLGCIPLQRGTITIGFLILFVSLLETCKRMMMLVKFEYHIQACKTAKLGLEPGSSEETLRDNSALCPTGGTLTFLRSTMVMPIFMFFIYFLLTALMIIGAKRNKPKLMAPWLWWQLAFYVVVMLTSLALRRVDLIILKISVIMVNMYLFLVVNSYYLQLLRRQNNPDRVTVIAMAHPRSEMAVSFPSPLKDYPPPLYSSSYTQSETSYPPPPYTPPSTRRFYTLPPPYQSQDPLAPTVSDDDQVYPPSAIAPQVSSTPASPTPTTSILATTTLATSTPVTSTPTSTTPATSSLVTSTSSSSTADRQEQGPSVGMFPSSPERAGELAPLVVKLSSPPPPPPPPPHA